MTARREFDRENLANREMSGDAGDVLIATKLPDFQTGVPFLCPAGRFSRVSEDFHPLAGQNRIFWSRKWYICGLYPSCLQRYAFIQPDRSLFDWFILADPEDVRPHDFPVPDATFVVLKCNTVCHG